MHYVVHCQGAHLDNEQRSAFRKAEKLTKQYNRIMMNFIKYSNSKHSKESTFT